MNILCDTHILLWAILDDPKLSNAARQLILDPQNDIYYSMVNVWEIAIKHMSHMESFRMDAKLFADLCVRAGYKELDGKVGHVYKLETLERTQGAAEHHDPFDRFLLAQAKAENFRFMTHDRLLKDYNEDLVIMV